MDYRNKRDRDLNSSGEQEVFKRSRKIIRSPQKSTSTTEVTKESSMGDLKEIKDMMKTMMDEIRSNTDENRKLRKEMREKEEKWETEKKELVGRIEQLESKWERLEKEKRRCNIVVKGVKFEEEVKEEAAKQFLWDKLGVDVEVNRVIDINKNGKTVNILEMGNWNKKQKVMMNKNKLKGSKIYIENDLTLKEREIQMEIRKIAKEETGNGHKTKIGYKKITIDGVEYLWDEGAKGVKEKENEEKTKN